MAGPFSHELVTYIFRFLQVRPYTYSFGINMQPVNLNILKDFVWTISI